MNVHAFLQIEPALRSLVRNANRTVKQLSRQFDAKPELIQAWLDANNEGSLELYDSVINAYKLGAGLITTGSSPEPGVIPAEKYLTEKAEAEGETLEDRREQRAAVKKLVAAVSGPWLAHGKLPRPNAFEAHRSYIETIANCEKPTEPFSTSRYMFLKKWLGTCKPSAEAATAFLDWYHAESAAGAEKPARSLLPAASKPSREEGEARRAPAPDAMAIHLQITIRVLGVTPCA